MNRASLPRLLLVVAALLGAVAGPVAAAPKAKKVEQTLEAFAEAAVHDALSDDVLVRQSGIVRASKTGELAVPHLVAALTRRPLPAEIEERAIFALQSLRGSVRIPLTEFLAATKDPLLVGTLCNVLSEVGGHIAVAAIKMVYERTQSKAVKPVAAAALKRLTGGDPEKLLPAAVYLRKLAAAFYARGNGAGRTAYHPSARIWTVRHGALIPGAVAVPETYFLRQAGRFAALALRADRDDAAARSLLLCARAAEFHTVDSLRRPRGTNLPAAEYLRTKKALTEAGAVGAASLAAALQTAIDHKTYGAAGELIRLLDTADDPKKPNAAARVPVSRLLEAPDKIARYRAALFLAQREEKPSSGVRHVLSQALREAADVTIFSVHPSAIARRNLLARAPGGDRQKFEAASVAAAAKRIVTDYASTDLIFFSSRLGDAELRKLIVALDAAPSVANAGIVVVLPSRKQVAAKASARFLLMRRVVGLVAETDATEAIANACEKHLEGGDNLYRRDLEAIAARSAGLLAATCRNEAEKKVSADLLRKAMTYGPTKTRVAAARALGVIGFAGDADRFGSMLLDTELSLEIRLAVGEAAGQIGGRLGKISDVLFAELRRALKNKNAEVRRVASQALARAPLSAGQKVQILDAR